MRIPLARDLSLSSRRPKLEKIENARTKGLLVHRSNGTDIEAWFRLRLPVFSKIATGTQDPFGALYDNKQLVKLISMIRIGKEPR